MKCLLVYAHGSGFGNIDCTFEKYPPTIDDIRNAEKQIKNVRGFSEMPRILNIIELSE